MPPPLQEWLPERYLDRFVSDIVNEPDLSAIESEDEDMERPGHRFARIGAMTVPNP